MEGGKGGKERREEEKGRMGWPRIFNREGLNCNISRAWEEGGECGGKASPETPKKGESLMISTNNDKKEWVFEERVLSKRAVRRIEPRTSCTQSKNHTTRPHGRDEGKT